MKRTRRIEFFEQIPVEREDPETGETFYETVSVPREGAIEAAMHEAASCVEMLDRLGGNVVIASAQERIADLGSEHQFQTVGMIFRYDSQMPTLRPRAEPPPADPDPEPEPAPEPDPVET